MQAVRSMLGVLSAALLIGCATKAPPSPEQIRQEAMKNIALPGSWKAGADAGPIADNWLAALGDPQLDALIAEALTNNPELRVTAVRVAQSAQYVELAKAALRPSVKMSSTGGINMGGGDALQAISLGVSWEPDLWGRTPYSRNAYQESYSCRPRELALGGQ